MDKQPLSIMLENAKRMTFQAFNQVQEKTQLPAFLMEGIVMELLADIRNQKNIELMSDFNRMNEQEDQKKEGEK
jgi:hypothetical protein|nr:MAG TPA: hypothetical protein [Caudoviricetes sp.]